MKLRELVANSLPRVRGKKKKSQQPDANNTSTPSPTGGVETATSRSQAKDLSSSKALQQDGNGNWCPVPESRLSFWDRLLGKDSTGKPPSRRHSSEQHSAFHDDRDQQRLDDSASSSSVLGLGTADFSSDPFNSSVASLGGSDCEYSDLPSPPFQEVSEPDCDLDSTCGYSSGPGCQEGLAPAGLSSGGQKAARCRSRIRTNPWLPSPRPSPYTARSFPFPCTSSRSSSPSPSPSPPPSTSDNVSPLTSPVNHFPTTSSNNNSNLCHHRRHRRYRRHHSEARAAAFVASLPPADIVADCDQYYSTPDSGIVEVPSSHDSRHCDDFEASSRWQPEPRRWTGQWDLDSPTYNDLNTAHFVSTPRVLQPRAKRRSKARRSEPGGNYLTGNLGSYRGEFEIPFSAAVGNRHSRTWDSDSDDGSVLSPSVSICALTSNIEQLAHNISYEYEDSRDVTFESEQSRIDESCPSPMRDELESSAAEVCPLPRRCQSASLSNRAGENPEVDGAFVLEVSGLHVTSGIHSLLGHAARTADVAVQTDFPDDDIEALDDDELNAFSNSDSDWLVHGSDCVAEEDGIVVDEECLLAAGAPGVENNKFWFMPDCMQDSTDTGYSSLSREGHTEIEDDVSSDDRPRDDSSRSHQQDVPAPAEVSDVPTPRSQNCDLSSGQISLLETFADCSDDDILKMDDFLADLDPVSRLEKEKTKVEKTGLCFCRDGVCKLFLKPSFQPSAHQYWRQSHLENVVVSDSIVPYPYDVTRFPDVVGQDFDAFTLRRSPFEEGEPREVSNERSKFRRSSDDSELLSIKTKDSHGGRTVRESVCPSASRRSARHPSQAIDVFSSSSSSSCQGDRSSTYFHESSVPSSAPTFSADDNRRQRSRSLSSHSLGPSLATGRSLREVTSSLEDKVFFLRQGKLLVQRKIREAREEEMLRQQQKLRLQRLLDIHRKQILLETLQGLRKRLESQSARLQASYSAVLDMQKSWAGRISVDPLTQ